MHQWSIFIFFQDLLLQIRLNLETSRSKRVKVPTTNQFLKHAPRANTSNTVCIYHKFFFIKNSLCYLPLVHIWQSWTFKASLLRYLPIIHHVCLKVFTCISLHDKSNSYIHVIFRHYIMQFEIQEHLSMFKKNVKKTSNRFKIWRLANRAKLLDTKSV